MAIKYGWFLALCLLINPAAAETVEGVFALSSKPAAVTGTLLATKTHGMTDALDIVMRKTGEAAPITAYDDELTKQLHVIIISDDFADFIHEHVTHVDKDGHFRLIVKFPRKGLYHIYTDGSPMGIGQQVLRFDVWVGGKSAARAPVSLNPSGLEEVDGAYAIKFTTLEVKAGQETMLGLQILKNGQPAPDVTPFLGVPAHAVFIDTKTLDYIHSHPMPMPMGDGMTSPSRLGLHLEPPSPRIYKLWIQFNGGGVLHTIPFVIDVKPKV